MKKWIAIFQFALLWVLIIGCHGQKEGQNDGESSTTESKEAMRFYDLTQTLLEKIRCWENRGSKSIH